MAEAKLHDVDPCKGRVGVEGGTGRWGSCRSEEVRRHSSNCHNLSVTCRMCVNVDPETAQPPPTSHASLSLNLNLSLFNSISRDHPLGRDLWQCCRSVVINIYYVTCMHRFELRSCFLPIQTRLRLRLHIRIHLRLLFQLQLQLRQRPRVRVRLRFRLRAGSAGVWYFNMLHEYESSKG